MNRMKNFMLKYGKNIHFIGIGGSGLFPVAKIMLSFGFNVTGSDIYESDTLQKVRALGIKVFESHSAQNIKNIDVVVRSAAIKNDNPEIIEAKKQKLAIFERSEMHGLITENYKNAVSVAGTHGKTTTAAMITHILLDAEKSPTAIIGGSLKRLNGNSCVGNSDILVSEACEYVDSFLKFHSDISVILNVEADHLDYFKDLHGVETSFEKFAKKTKKLLIVNGEDDSALRVVRNSDAKKIFFGINLKNKSFVEQFSAKNIVFDSRQLASFDLMHNDTKVSEIKLGVPGMHNVYNVLAAIIVCLNLGVDIQVIKSSISKFYGVHRRFEFLGIFKGVTIVDDFAHHPKEISATLKTAKCMGFKRIIAVFQPHTYSRTFKFLNKFAESLSIADMSIVTEILPVREKNIYNIYSEDLVRITKNSVYLKTFQEVCDFVLNNAKERDLILTMGGGNIYKCAQMIVDKLSG